MELVDQMLDVQPIVDWLIDGAKPATDNPKEWLRALSLRMVDCGLPIHRVAMFVRPLHPNVAARAFYWREDTATVEVNDEKHGFMSTDEYLSNPVPAVTHTRQQIRRRLCDRGTRVDFPVLHKLRKDGFTDYLIMPLEFIDGEVHAFSVATKRAGGFTNDQVAALQRVKPAVTRIVEILGLTRKARNILEAYLGRHAGRKVLQGRIQRGDTEKLHAVIWFCDLRESTSFADSMGAQAFLAMLNEYFDAVLGPVMDRGGEVLSFIGDAALAIFPVAQDLADAATRAVNAAMDSISRMRIVNDRREKAGSAPLRFGIGLHLGELLYGNVGTRSRITFTVVGAAANEAARIEALCETLDASPLVSEQVASQVPLEWQSLGRHRLRGVGKPIKVFTL